MTQSTVLILGANGRIGSALVDAFSRAGWQVISQARQGSAKRQTAQVIGDMREVNAVVKTAAAIGRIDVVIHAANVIYTRWAIEAIALNDAAINITKALGATLLLPGNVYNFGTDMPERLEAQTPQRGQTSKGKIRVVMEQALAVAAERGTQSIVIRAGDFFGSGTGSWFDQVIVKDIEKGKLTYPGPLDMLHAWAYLPDLAQTFVNVAEARRALARFENIHFNGHAVTGHEFVKTIEQIALRPLKVSAMPWRLIRALGIVKPLMRDLAEMSYLWQRPHRLVTSAAHAPLMAPTTPLVQAVKHSLAIRMSGGV